MLLFILNVCSGTATATRLVICGIPYANGGRKSVAYNISDREDFVVYIMPQLWLYVTGDRTAADRMPQEWRIA
jgi:hypothetical protein